MKNFILGLVAVLVGTCAFAVRAQVQSFPGVPWSDLRLVRTKTAIGVEDASGRRLATLNGEPGGVSVEKVAAAIVADGLSVDAGAAFKNGLRKLVLTTAGVDRGPLAGKLCVLETRLAGPRGSEVRPYFEGHGPGEIGHFYRSVKVMPKGKERVFPLLTDVPAGLNELHLRFDIARQPAGQPVVLKSFRFASSAELPWRKGGAAARPELLFRADFENSADATCAKGSARPTRAKNLAYAPGVAGQALRVSGRARSLLEYAVKDNVNPARGTVALWVKREWDFSAAKQPWRTLFAFPWQDCGITERVGSGALWFWFLGETLRADPADDEDSYKTCNLPMDGEWTHLVYEWDEEGVKMFVNGKNSVQKSDSASPMAEALRAGALVAVDRSGFRTFTVGSRGNCEWADALIDDFRVYSEPLGPESVKALYREHAPKGQAAAPRVDYAKLFAAETRNPCELIRSEPPNPKPRTRNLEPETRNLELVRELKLDGTAPRRLGKDRFNSVGGMSFKALDGVPYLELDAKAGSRVAFRFNVDTNAPLYCFEFDYPDDAKRTADLIVQPCRGGDYVMQVGYAAGDEYPNTGKILTHRCLYWSSVPDVAVVLMTARDGAPAALSAIRLYRVKAGALPVAAVKEPKPNADGWRRTVALYYEDPAIGYDFGLPRDVVATPQGLGKLIDRAAALMKYTGENLLAYPGAWYHGLIGDDYNPRNHPQDFLRAWYEKFGREGLGFIPTVNPNTMPVEDGLVTLGSMLDGSLHPTEIAIHDTGKPNWGQWHDTPPNFNFHHPKVQAHVERIIDTLLEQGRDYPAFKGICLHLTRHNMLWFGDEKSGYNDYTVKAFERAAKVKVRGEGEEWRAPLRGKLYYERITGDPALHEKWLQWRCDQVTAFYARQAKKLAAARPDLKLWLNSMVPADSRHPDFTRPDYMARANRSRGLDGAALSKAASNLILGQTLVPADYRWRDRGYPSPAARDHQRVLDTLPGFYSLLDGAKDPWVHQHDRYWESAIGRAGGSLSSPWMTECGWRVSTINPSGRNALRHFVQPLRHRDVLGLSKGGFLVGTYGMEDVLVPFVRAFRALPAVVMDEVGRAGNVVARQADFDGKSYFYIVNTDLSGRTLDVTFPPGTTDLVTGEAVPERTTLSLKSYDLRAYVAPSGRPAVGKAG